MIEIPHFYVKFADDFAFSGYDNIVVLILRWKKSVGGYSKIKIGVIVMMGDMLSNMER